MTTWTPPLMFGPIAPENNPPINPQYYLPSVFDIFFIDNGVTTLVATVGNHNYVVGQLVRLLVPEIYGAAQFNEQEAYVIDIPQPNEVTLLLDSTNFNILIPNFMSGTTQPQIVAVGDVNTGATNTGRSGNGTFIPGSFIDISPA